MLRKKYIFVKIVCSFLLLSKLVSAQEYGIKGFFPVQNYYRPKDSFIYSLLIHPSNYVITGSENGLSFFDGYAWKSLKKDSISIISQALASDGKVYVGGSNEIGYIDVNQKGQFEYYSLKKLVPKNINIGTIFCVREFNNTIYFFGDKYRISLKGKDIKLTKRVSSKVGWFMGFVMFHKLYIFEPEQGLCELRKDNTLGEDVSKGFFHANDMDIRAVQPLDRTSYLIFTALNGVYLFDGKTLIPYKTKADKMLSKAFVLGATQLKNGDYALATGVEGVLILSSKGDLLQKIDERCGIAKNSILSVVEDKQGGLWCSFQGGVSHIQLQTNIEYFNQLGLNGDVSDLIESSGNLYVATNEGTYKASIHNQSGIYTRFEKILNIYNTCILSFGQSLFVGTNQGFYRYDGKNTHSLSPKPLMGLATLPGGTNALLAINETDQFPLEIWEETGGKWQKTTVKNRHFDAAIVSGFEKISDNLFSLRFGESSAFLFRFPQKGEEWDFQHPEFKKVKSMPIHHAKWKGQTIYNAGGKIVRVDFENGISVDEDFYKSYPQLRDLRVKLVNNPVDSDTLFLIVAEKTQGLPHSFTSLITCFGDAGQLSKQQNRFNVNSFDKFKYVKGEIWRMGEKGMGKIITTGSFKESVNPFSTVISHVVTNGDSVLYQAETLTNLSIQHYPYSFNRFKFTFKALNYVASEEETLYQYQLKGSDDTWSSWSSERIKEYTNLPPGNYTFLVRSLNSLGQQGSVASFEFSIDTPWFKSWYAYILYVVVILSSIVFIYQWRYRTLYQEKRKLEDLVTKRTEDLQKKNKLLEVQTEKLEQMDRAKSNFFANISHEFKTPLTLIQTPLENRYLHMENGRDKEELRVMLKSTQRLKRLIDQMLELSKLENNQMEVFYQKGDFTAFFYFMIEPFTIQALQKEINLEVFAPEQQVEAYFDTNKMESIITNVLSNAFKFTKDDIKISLSYGHGEEAVLRISDNGTGIPYEQQEHIFKRFYQMENTFYGNYDGSGIGLALTKELLHLLKGTIEVKSTPNMGAEFTIRVPLQIPNNQTNFSIVDGVWESSQREYGLSIEQENNVQPTSLTLEGMPLVLIVEDHPDMLNYLQINLEKDYRIVSLQNGLQGLAYATEHLPDLIISDMMMPEMDGFTFCSKIREDESTCHIPFILLTAKDSIPDRVAGIEFGADVYLTKPFNLHELQANIKNLLWQRKRLRDLYQQSISLNPEQIAVVPKDARFLQKIKEVIDHYLADETLSVELIASQMHIDKRTLHRKIKALTNQSTNVFIRNYRLRRAYQLIEADSDPIKNIAYEVGFNNVSYFTKCFKETFGILPSELKVQQPE